MKSRQKSPLKIYVHVEKCTSICRVYVAIEKCVKYILTVATNQVIHLNSRARLHVLIYTTVQLQLSSYSVKTKSSNNS